MKEITLKISNYFLYEICKELELRILSGQVHSIDLFTYRVIEAFKEGKDECVLNFTDGSGQDEI